MRDLLLTWWPLAAAVLVLAFTWVLARMAAIADRNHRGPDA